MVTRPSESAPSELTSVARQVTGRALLVALLIASELLIHLELVARSTYAMMTSRRIA
jgi:hypothetical protein